MNLPGFTAEAAIFSSNTGFQSMPADRTQENGKGVIPAYRFVAKLSCRLVPRITCGLCDPNTGVCPPCFTVYDLVCPGHPEPPR